MVSQQDKARYTPSFALKAVESLIKRHGVGNFKAARKKIQVQCCAQKHVIGSIGKGQMRDAQPDDQDMCLREANSGHPVALVTAAVVGWSGTDARMGELVQGDSRGSTRTKTTIVVVAE